MKVRLLFTLSQAFPVTGRGLILSPGVNETSGVKPGDGLLLERPNGLSALATTVRGLATFNRAPGSPVPVLVDLKVSAADLPEGTQVFLDDGTTS